MVDMDSLRRSIKDSSNAIDSLNSSLNNSNKVTGTLVQSFSDLASMRGKPGTIWSIVGRLSSGTVLYDIQNRLRGIMVIFRLMEENEKARVKAATELDEIMKNTGGILKDLTKTYKGIDDILEGSNKKLAKSIMIQNDISKLRIREVGFEKYLEESRSRALVGVKEQLKVERMLLDTDKARENLSDRSKEILGDDFKTGFFGNPDKEATLVQMFGINDEIKELRESKKTLRGEEKAAVDEEINLRVEMMKVLKEEMAERFNVRTKVDRFGNIREFGDIRRKGKRPPAIEKIPKDSLAERFKKFNVKTFSDLITIAKKAFLTRFNKKNFNKIFRFAVTGLMVFGKILYGITLLGLLVFLLHKSGIIDYLMEFFTSDNFKTIFGDFVDGLVDILSGVWSVITGIFKIITSLYTGDTGGIGEGLMSIGEGLIGILLGSGQVILTSLAMTLVTILIGGIGSIATVVIKTLETFGQLLVTGAEKAKDMAPKLGVVGGFISGAKLGGTAGSIVPGAGTVGGALIGGIGGALIGGGVGSVVQGFASGGTVGKGGLFMVGERGPELVNLPAGSAVYNNQQTRSMMGGNTINVSVNGRVGASDAELDDIAKKIGRKINLEMNRYNNSGYRA